MRAKKINFSEQYRKKLKKPIDWISLENLIEI